MKLRLPLAGWQAASRRRPLRALLRWAWWLAGLLTLLSLSWFNPSFVQRLDLLAYDLLVPTRPAMAQSPVLIAIDDASLSELGRWPWPRSRFAEMIDRLGQSGAGAIGLAVMFSEPDRDDPAGDAALAAAIARNARVVLPVAPSLQGDGRLDRTPLMPNLAQAGEASAFTLGHVDVEMDLDGQARRLYLLAGQGRADLPALALAVRQQMPLPLDWARLPGVRPSLARLQSQTAWVRDREVMLPRMQPLPTLSFSSVLRSPQQLALVRGRAVFIGVTASGLGGELVTPLARGQSTLPAVEFHAQAYAALVQQSLLQRAPAAWSVLLTLVLLSSLVLWRKSEGRRALLVTGMLGVPLLLSVLLLQTAQAWSPPATATLTLAVALLVWWAGKFQLVRRQLLRSRQHADATLHAIGEAVVTIDAVRRTIRYANVTAQRQTGNPQMLGLTLEQAYPLSADSLIRLDAVLSDCLQQNRRVDLPGLLSLNTPAQGPLRLLRASVNPLHSPENRLDGAVLVLSDVTEAVAAARELDHTTTHDALTGLPNRVLLNERLSLALARAQRSGKNAAILLLDLDRFKYINESLGHRTGDEVLKVMAQRLRQLCNETDTVARWGGDEFVVVLEDLPDQEAAATVAAQVIDVLTQDIVLDASFGSVRLPSAGSVGVVMSPQDGTDVDDLLSKADMAMYRAKAKPQASFQFWSDEINTRMHERLALEVDIRQGMREQQFVLHYQPQFSLTDQRLVGMEALMRWQRSPQDLRMPGDFIAVAEESGLIVDLGAWAVLHAARQVALWLAAGLTPVPVAVNVSARQCLNSDIVQIVRSALKETQIPPALLRLEITETTAMSDPDQVIELFLAIRDLGVGLVVDDFGTGYSSLSYLKRFPIDELKIDRSFVSDVVTDKNDAAIVRATIALAHGLGLKVVAEGVETAAQSSFLMSQNCDIAQGYLFGRPQPLTVVTKLLR